MNKIYNVIYKYHLIQLILFVVIGLPYIAKGQGEILTSSKVERILEVLEEEHIQPVDVSTKEHSAYIFTAFLTSVDPSYLFFSDETVASWKSYRTSIGESLKNGNISFFSEVKSKFYSAVENREHELLEMTSEDLWNFSGEYIDTFVTSVNLQNQFLSAIRSSVVKEVLYAIDLDSFIYDDNKVKHVFDSCFSIVHQDFRDYLEFIKEDSRDFESKFLNAITTAFDPHSNYFTVGVNESFEQELSAQRELFGISYEKNTDNEIVIADIVPGSSAWLSGEVHPGDKIISIQFGKEKLIRLKGKSLLKLSSLFNENDADEITLELESNGKKVFVELHKTAVYSDSDVIKYGILEGEKSIGYIELPDFYLNWTDTTALGCANDIAKAIIKMKKEGIDGLILDLRDNGGGSLQEAIDLVGIFINYGPVLVKRDSDGDIYSLKDRNRGAIYYGPLVVMVNEYSASASEVTASALQDYNRAVIVGNKTFGKATGQYVKPMSETDNEADIWGYLKITTMSVYGIDLESHQKEGVSPDVELKEVFKPGFAESDYSTALELDSINKKVYFTPAAQLPVDNLSSRSKERQLNIVQIQQLEQIVQRMEELIESIDYSSSELEDIFTVEQELLKVEKSIKDVFVNTDVFTIQTTDQEQTILEMSDYMKAYREKFENRILKDYEIEEAYRIMLDLINLN